MWQWGGLTAGPLRRMPSHPRYDRRQLAPFSLRDVPGQPKGCWQNLRATSAENPTAKCPLIMASHRSRAHNGLVNVDWTTGTSKRHVFISYVSEDEVRAKSLQSAFEAAGVEVWRDKKNLIPGSDWATEIRSAITRNSLAFIPCFSKGSTRRGQSYQYDELLSAIDHFRKLPPNRRWIFPVRFDPVVIPDYSLGAGRTLKSLHSADLFGPDRDRNLVRLTKAVSNLGAK